MSWKIVGEKQKCRKSDRFSHNLLQLSCVGKQETARHTWPLPLSTRINNFAESCVFSLFVVVANVVAVVVIVVVVELKVFAATRLIFFYFRFLFLAFLRQCLKYSLYFVDNWNKYLRKNRNIYASSWSYLKKFVSKHIFAVWQKLSITDHVEVSYINLWHVSAPFRIYFSNIQ